MLERSQLLEMARDIKIVIFDSIGVLFSSVVTYDGNGEAFRTRSHVDGQGISMLRSAGIQIVFMSASDDPFIRALTDRFNSLPSVKNGSWPPVELFTGIIGEGKLKIASRIERRWGSWSYIAYMGDDIGDYEVMREVGLRVTPANGEKIIKDIAEYVTSREGGNGAVRDLCDLILEAQDVDITKLDLR